MLGAALGDERRDAYALVRQVQAFSLVCKSWRAAVATTPLHINLDYLTDLPFATLRWLQVGKGKLGVTTDA